MRQQNTDSAISAVCLDWLGTSQRLQIPALGLTGNHGAEDAETELGAGCEAIRKLRCSQQLQSTQGWQRDKARHAFSGVALCSGSEKAAFSSATTDSKSEMVSGLVLGKNAQGRAFCKRASGLSLAARLFWLSVFWVEAKSLSTSSESSTAWSISLVGSGKGPMVLCVDQIPSAVGTIEGWRDGSGQKE